MRSTHAFLAVAVVGLTSAANAAFISFANDSGGSTPTLRGSLGGGGVTITDNAKPLKTLTYDPFENGDQFARNVRLTLSAPLINPVSIGADALFDITGFTFSFRNAVTNEALITFVAGPNDPARFFALGGLNGMISGSISATGQYTIGAGIAAQFGFAGETTVSGQASFTLTGLNPNPVVFTVNNQALQGITEFRAQSSFSGSFVPTPGAIALAAIAGVAVLRRRR